MDSDTFLLRWSADSEPALYEKTRQILRYLATGTTSLASVAHTLKSITQPLPFRAGWVVRDGNITPETIITGHNQPRTITFMFPGIGDHYPNMGRDLYKYEPVFHNALDQCNTILEPLLGRSILSVVYPNDETPINDPAQNGIDLRAMLRRTQPQDTVLSQTKIAHPLVFAIEYALAKLLSSWGVHPNQMVGYSLGEYVCATLAGTLTLHDALTLVVRRAELITDLPNGRMLAVPLSREQLTPYLTDQIYLAGHNGQNLCVVAGSIDGIIQLQDQLRTQKIACQLLTATHPFHTPLLQSVAQPLRELVATFDCHPPQIPYLSNVTGNWIGASATDPDYWTQHLCQPVNFFGCLQTLLAGEQTIMIEIGAGQSLGSFAKQHPACTQDQLGKILPTMRYSYDHQSDNAFFQTTIAKLWVLGGNVAPPLGDEPALPELVKLLNPSLEQQQSRGAKRRDKLRKRRSPRSNVG